MDEVMEIQRQERADACEEFDVLIVGAGMSGIGSAYHLKTQCPDKSFAVLEAQDLTPEKREAAMARLLAARAMLDAAQAA